MRRGIVVSVILLASLVACGGGGGTVGQPADKAAPTVPANLTATAVSASQINLSWTPSTDNTGVAGYEVWRGSTLVTTVTTSSFSDSGLVASTLYEYSIKAYDAAGNITASSVPASATTLAPPPVCNNPPQAADDAAGAAFLAQQVVPVVNTDFGPEFNLVISHSTLTNTSPLNFYPGQPVAISTNVVDIDTAACGAQVITYAWSFASNPAGSGAAFNDAASPTPSFTPDLPGNYVVRLTLTDQDGYQSVRDFTSAAARPLVPVSACGTASPVGIITVSGPNPGSPGDSSTTAAVSQTVSFTAAGSSTTDAVPLDLATGTGCGLPIAYGYAWSFTGTPDGVVPALLPNATSLAASFVPTAAGLYKVQLVVTVGAHTSTPVLLNVTVSP